MSKTKILISNVDTYLHKYLYKIGELIPRLPLVNKFLEPPLTALFRKIRHAYLPNPVTTNDFTFYYCPDDTSLAFQLFRGDYEKETMVVFKSLVRSGMTVVDLGANIGYYAINAARLVGSVGRVYAFEPNAPIYQILLKNVTANKCDNIIISVPKAAWSENAVLSFWNDAKDPGSSSVFRTHHHQQTNRVDAIKLDDFFKQKDWPDVHVIKMDIEGAEKAALQGMRGLIERNQDIKLIMEFNPGIQKGIGMKYNELIDELIEIGFRKISVIKNGLHPMNIPDDIHSLVKIAGTHFVNVLCEK